MNLIEKWGSGIPNMVRDCKAYGLPDLEFIDFESAIRINMYRKTTQSNGTPQFTTQLPKTTQFTTRYDTPVLTLKEQKLLQVIQEHPEMGQKKFAEELEWTVDQVKYYLRKLTKMNIVHHVGTSRKGHWEVMNKKT